MSPEELRLECLRLELRLECLKLAQAGANASPGYAADKIEVVERARAYAEFMMSPQTVQ